MKIKILLIAALFSLVLLDAPLAWLFQHNPHYLKAIARSASYLINPLFIACISTLLLLMRKETLFKNAISLGSGFFVVRVLKWLIGRSRPNILYSDQIFTCQPFNLSSDFQSFPSSHALAIFTIATTCAFIWPKYRAWIFSFAAVLALSRVILHQHYLSDVAFGSVIGWFVTQKIGQVKLARLKH